MSTLRQIVSILLSCSLLLSPSYGYYLSLNALEWPNASTWCQAYCQSHLASIHSLDNHLSALQLIDRNPYIYTRAWIGLNDIAMSDTWTWSDGSLFDYGNVIDTTTGYTVRGTYPWRSDEPDYNDTDQCVAYEVGSNYLTSSSRKWVDRKSSANYQYFCNECSGKLHKYAAINGARNHSAANDICQSYFGTSLASIHSDSDMVEARLSCKELTASNGCWLGLNDIVSQREYVWTDGTEFDYGQTLYQYPWYSSEPGISVDQRCIFLDPSNGADLGEYLWDDYWCDSAKPRALCNAPSEICYESQWEMPRGLMTDWEFSKNPCFVFCELTKLTMDSDSNAVIGGKQWYNAQGVLLVDMMYKISDVGIYGNAGVTFYFDTAQSCDYYYVGIWGEYSMLFIGKMVNDEWTLIDHASLPFTFQMNTYYSLKVQLTNGNQWNMYFNDVLLTLSNAKGTNVFDDSFNNSNNVISGYVGIRTVNAAIGVKSLFVSGDPIYDEYFFESAWYHSCTMAPTNHPTEETLNPTTHRPSTNPTFKPTQNPTLSPITKSPTIKPTDAPTIVPTKYPSTNPTISPTFDPSISPTLSTLMPSTPLTMYPTKNPTLDPTFKPTLSPQTMAPSQFPTMDVGKNESKKGGITEVLATENRANNAIIWIIGIPIGVLFMSVFGVYLLYSYYESQNDDKRKESEHVRAPSGTAGIDMAEDEDEIADIVMDEAPQDMDEDNVLSEDQSLVSEINAIEDVDGELLDHKMTDDGMEQEMVEMDEQNYDIDDDNQEDKPLKDDVEG